MRCPKCGYISFDIIDSCVKCGKDISGAANELEGTVASVPAPSFLRIPGSETSEETAGVDVEEPLDLGSEDEGEMEISLDEESSVETEEFAMDLGAEEEAEAEIDLGEADAGSEDVPEIDLGEEQAEAVETSEAETDFGLDEEPEEEAAIGISDLAPSEETEEEPVEEAGSQETKGGGGLESLEVEGIDLDTAPDVDETGKVAPSVKTGTALDDFDIDLGDLLTGKEDD